MLEQAPILITGCPRSGTSMIAATIIACGAFGGVMGKRGMYSNDRIRESLVKSYLNRIGADVDGMYPLPNTVSIPTNWKQSVDEIMRREEYKEGPWMYKDSRMCQMWQVWNNAYPNAKWVIVRRRTGDILESCMKTMYMTRFKDLDNQKAVGATNEREGWLWMVHQYEFRFIEMITAGLNCKIIWPERMVQKDYQQIYELCEWLGLTWNEKALDSINTLLWGNKQKERRTA